MRKAFIIIFFQCYCLLLVAQSNSNKVKLYELMVRPKPVIDTTDMGISRDYFNLEVTFIVSNPDSVKSVVCRVTKKNSGYLIDDSLVVKKEPGKSFREKNELRSFSISGRTMIMSYPLKKEDFLGVKDIEVYVRDKTNKKTNTVRTKISD